MHRYRIELKGFKASRKTLSRWGLLLTAWVLATIPPVMGNEVTTAPQSGAHEFQKILKLVGSSPTGAWLIEQAKVKFALPEASDLDRLFVWSRVSKTDAVLTRQFDQQTGEEVRTREVVIYLRHHDRFEDTVLDLAHELTHATFSPSWDPYDPDLDVITYVKNGIEGLGGEADALMTECQVGAELKILDGVSKTRCTRYGLADSRPRRMIASVSASISEGGDLSAIKQRVVNEFYQVGSEFGRLGRLLGPRVSELTHLTKQPSELISSTGGASYPLSLYSEYEELNRIACVNTKRRKSQVMMQKKERKVGSVSRASGELASIEELLRKRCEDGFRL